MAPIATSLTVTPASSAADDADPVARLAEIVNAPPKDAATADREEAALQLVARDTPASRDDVLSALKNTANSAAQAAITKALADVPNPDPALIPVLAGLLPNATLTDAAATALANYRGNPQAFEFLKRFADMANAPVPNRAFVIHCIGSLIDPPAADYLVAVAGDPRQSAAIQTAAMQSLGEMTGITEFGTDIGQWNKWWAGVKGKNQDQFRAMLLEARARKLEVIKQRDQLLAESARTLLINDYVALPAPKQPGVLKAYLSDRAAEVRGVGLSIVRLENSSGKPPTAEVRKRLFQLISDSDDKVRYEVVDFLLTLNDPACLQPLINQLATEKNPEVARKIAQILGSLKDAASAPAVARALTPMLHGPNQENQISAAKALASLGENLRQNDPKLADDLSDQLRTILKNIDNQPGTESMRAASIAALAALRDPKSMDTFLNCFKPGETTEVRKAALAGLGNLGDTRANATVIQQLGDADPTVRLEAARALARVATPDQDVPIFGQMKTDRNQEVRDALWIAVKNLYDKEQPDQIKHWASELKNDPEREIVTLEKLSDVLKRGNDARSIASNEEDIAAALTAVKPVTPARAGEAIGHLQQALDYWRGPGKGAGGSDENLETLVGEMVDAKLLAEQWKDACDFASQQIKQSPDYSPTIGPIIRDHIDKLISGNSPADAQKLIEAALAMNPPLDHKIVGQIRDQQAQLNQKPPAP